MFIQLIGLGKIKTVEIVVRGEIVEKNLILKFANRLRDSKIRADFSSTIAVPPFLEAVEKRYPRARAGSRTWRRNCSGQRTEP